MKKIFLAVLLSVFCLSLTYGQQQTLPAGARYLSLDEQQRLLLQVGRDAAGVKTQAGVQVDGGGSSNAPVYGAISASVNFVGNNLVAMASYSNSQEIPAYSSIIACKDLPGEGSSCNRGVSFGSYPVSPGWTLDIITALTPSWADWSGTGSVTVYVFGPNGVGTTRHEFNFNQAFENPRRFLFSPQEEANGDISIRTTESFADKTIYIVLKDKERFRQYNVPVSATAVKADRIFINMAADSQLQSVTQGNYRLSVSVDGASDTVDVRLMRVISSQRGGNTIDKIRDKPSGGEPTSQAQHTEPAATPTTVVVVAGSGLNPEPLQDKDKKKGNKSEDKASPLPNN